MSSEVNGLIRTYTHAYVPSLEPPDSKSPLESGWFEIMFVERYRALYEFYNHFIFRGWKSYSAQHTWFNCAKLFNESQWYIWEILQTLKGQHKVWRFETSRITIQHTSYIYITYSCACMQLYCMVIGGTDSLQWFIFSTYAIQLW